MTREIANLPVPSTYARLLVQRWPGQAADLLAGTALQSVTLATLAARATITVSEQLQVFRNAGRLAGRPDWALDFGRQLNINSHGPLGFAALSAPTLGEGLDVFGRFARIRAPYLGFEARQSEQHIELHVDTGLYPLGELELPTLELVMQIALSYVDAVIGLDAVDVQLCLRRPPPAHAERYPEALRARCQFHAGFDGIAMPVGLKGIPCPLHDEKTYASSLQRCREALDAVLSPDDVVARADHWLAGRFDQGVAGAGRLRTPPALPRLEELAAALCLSPRTLNRRLAGQGTRFGELRAARQLELACKLLGDARYTVGEIGESLGYGDAANFGRAFRRMTGLSPGQYRRR
ncbi:MAG: AraC family transcriptional regulator ligand-binding domain-containing protein [Rhodocyclaceae bacterium]|jgi:AraC-like DNA-binding protein|nr:AraC family transcriptional regulator ligand-binding domain-containing protein [Rhodocyclaceae bacterium]MBK6909032.1 AraC family transcriptional regulator ligand-binding domain-containing protein [Rhodocyclaceae bacterium]